MCRIRVHSRASVCVHDQRREKKRKRQVNELNVRSSWKKETPSLERINTSRIKRVIIVRQWILTDLYTLSIRGSGSINRIFFSLSSTSLGTTIGTGIISVIKRISEWCCAKVG